MRAFWAESRQAGFPSLAKVGTRFPTINYTAAKRNRDLDGGLTCAVVDFPAWYLAEQSRNGLCSIGICRRVGRDERWKIHYRSVRQQRKKRYNRQPPVMDGRRFVLVNNGGRNTGLAVETLGAGG